MRWRERKKESIDCKMLLTNDHVLLSHSIVYVCVWWAFNIKVTKHWLHTRYKWKQLHIFLSWWNNNNNCTRDFQWIAAKKAEKTLLNGVSVTEKHTIKCVPVQHRLFFSSQFAMRFEWQRYGSIKIIRFFFVSIYQTRIFILEKKIRPAPYE